MKVFKVNFSYSDFGKKIKQSRLVKAEDEKTAAKMFKVWNESINSDITNFLVTSCEVLNEKQIKLTNPHNYITPENYNRWIKDKKSITSAPAKVTSKPLTQISWLKKKTAISTPAQTASKPLTQIPWLMKKPVEKSVASTPAKPVEKTETDWDKINALTHNREFDTNNE